MTTSKLYDTLFNSKKGFGKIFNHGIMALIIISVGLSMYNTLPNISYQIKNTIQIIQKITLFIFTLEYLLRVVLYKKRKDYILSFYGVVDLLTILPLLFGSSGGSIVRLL